MSEIRFAAYDDIAAIRGIWSASFPEDTAQERDRFLSMVQFSEECVLSCIDGKPVSMAFFLPAALRTDSGEFSMRYLYAASTLPAYRGRGVFAELLRTALQMLKKRGIDACFLNPAEPTLIHYYHRFGYEPTFFCRTITGQASETVLPIVPLSASEYGSVRRAGLPSEHVVWDTRLIDYAASYAVPVLIGQQDACALCVKSGDTLRILELLGVPSEKQTAVCGALTRYFGCDTFSARLYADSGDCFGMLLPLAVKEIPLTQAPYMGLAFD